MPISTTCRQGGNESQSLTKKIQHDDVVQVKTCQRFIVVPICNDVAVFVQCSELVLRKTTVYNVSVIRR